MKEIKMKFIERIVERMVSRSSGPEAIKTLLVTTSMVSFGFGGLFEKLSHDLDCPYFFMAVMVFLSGAWMCCLNSKKQNSLSKKD